MMIDLTEERIPGYGTKIIGTNPTELGKIPSELMAEVETKKPKVKSLNKMFVSLVKGPVLPV